MPFKNSADKLAYMKEWRQKKGAEGYNKALYARRKRRLDNEQILREIVKYTLKTIKKVERLTNQGKGLDTAIVLNELRLRLEETLREAAPVAGKPITYMPKDEHAE